MPEVRIAAEPRTEFGKGPARRERRANGYLPWCTAMARTPGTSPCPAMT